ncbi:hypothetical protein AHAS_Ahas05G0160300 [Arachis hypogaea]
MADRGKAKVTSQKQKKSQSFTASPFSDYAKNPFSKKDKTDQLLPPTNREMFPNLYCELRFPTFQGAEAQSREEARHSFISEAVH